MGDEVEFWLNFSSGGARAVATTNANLQPGVWNHVAGVWNGQRLIVRVNGAERASLSLAGQPNVRQPAASDALFIGAAPWQGEEFHGCIDEVRISNIARPGSVSGVDDWSRY
jgi:hypothetical protein